MKIFLYLLLFSVTGFSTEYIFIKGLFNERNYSYFKENIFTLKKLGVHQSQIHVISPPSTKTAEDNIPLLKEKIDSLEGDIVIFAHSMGGATVYRYLLAHLPEAEKKIRAIFFVQAALGGSRLGDLAFGVGGIHHKKFSEFEKFCYYYAGHTNYMRKSCHAPALFSMTENQSQRFLERAQELKSLSDKIFYIISHQDYFLNSFPMSLTGKFLSFNYGLNDGIVLEKDQFISGVGTVLMRLKTDHAGLTCTWPVSMEPRRLQQDMMKVIFSKVQEIGRCPNFLISQR